MKTHIGPIYLILGAMAVAALTIGAKAEHHEAPAARVAALATALPAPPAATRGELVVVLSPSMDGDVEAKVEAAIAALKARKGSG
jgi:hypothetical protein